MKKIVCIFCGIEGSKAREHIWPLWLQKLENEEKIMYDNIHCSFFGGNISKRNLTLNKFVLGNVCSKCNNGWMSVLENNFKEVFLKIKLNNYHLKKLTRIEKRNISLWGLKTAITLNAGTNYRKLVPNNHYSTLCNYGRIPSGVTVFISKIKDSNGLNHIQSPIISVGHNRSINIDALKMNQDTYNIVLGIGDLCIQVTYMDKSYGKKIACTSTKSIKIHPKEKNPKIPSNINYETLQEVQLGISYFIK